MTGSGRLLALLAVAVVVDTAAYATITPLLPGLVGEYHLTKASAGVLSASYAAGTFALSLPAAWVASRTGPKRTIIGALALLAGASVTFGLARSAGLLVAARALQGVGAAAIWAGGLAWVVAIAPRERRAEALGTVIGAAIAGALGGPVLGAAAHALGFGVVYGAFVILPLGLIVVLAGQPGPQAVHTSGLDAVRQALRDPHMRLGLWLMAVPALAFGLINVLVPLRLDELGAGPIVIGAVFLGAIAFEAAMSPIAGRIADRSGARGPARIGLGLGGLVLALLALPDAVVPLALGVMVAAPLFGTLWTPAMALLSRGAEDRGVNPAFAFGLANLAWGAGSALGGSGGGALAQAAGDSVPYVLLGMAALATAAVLREPRPSALTAR